MARYVNGARRFFDTRADRTPAEIADVDFDFDSVVVYGKGLSIMSALATVIGKDLFDTICLRCLDEFGGNRMGIREFRAVCEDAVRKDLGWFFDQWVNSSRYLSYEITSQQTTRNGDRYVSEVRIECLGTLRMPVPVAAYFEDGTIETGITDRFLDINILRFESSSPLMEVKLDPESELALVVPPPSIDGAILGRALDQMEYQGVGELAVDLYRKALEVRFADGSLWNKLGVALFDGQYYREALSAFEHAATFLANEGSPYTFASYAWQGHTHDILGDRRQAIQCYQEALRRDTGRTSEYSGFDIKINRRWIEERMKRPFQSD
jgi:aminopeptidase N